MKKLISVVWIFFVVLSVSGQSKYKKTDGYVIRGEIEGNYEQGKVYLIAEREIQGEFQIIDSAEVKDNRYVFRGGTVKYPRMHFIKSADPDCASPLTPFFLENGEIEICAKADFFMNSTVKGTPNNDIYSFYRFQQRYERDSMQMGYALEHNLYGDQSFEVENRKFKERSQATSDFTIRLGKRMVELFPDQAFAPFVIYWSLRHRLTLEDLKALRAKLSPLITGHPYTAQLDNFIRLSSFGVGSMMFDFSLPDPNGKEIHMSDFRGRYVLVDFWASWCGPCRGELPGMVSMYQKCRGKNFEILGVSLDRKRDAWLEAIRKYHLKWPQVCDFKMWGTLPAQLCGVTAVPYTVLVDPEGKVVEIGLRGEKLYERIMAILGQD